MNLAAPAHAYRPGLDWGHRVALCLFALLFSSTLWASEPSATTEPQEAPACKKPEYPAASLRNNEQGIVNASFLIGVDGNVIDKKIVKSSGFINLDNAVLDALGKCRFKRAKADVAPEQAWFPVQYVWALK